MEAYKFKTQVKEKGIIQIPEIARFANQAIEVFIVVKPEKHAPLQKKEALENFLSQWQGVLKGADVDTLKAAYLEEKYG